jgi:hypothetical protein
MFINAGEFLYSLGMFNKVIVDAKSDDIRNPPPLSFSGYMGRQLTAPKPRMDYFHAAKSLEDN